MLRNTTVVYSNTFTRLQDSAFLDFLTYVVLTAFCSRVGEHTGTNGAKGAGVVVVRVITGQYQQ